MRELRGRGIWLVFGHISFRVNESTFCERATIVTREGRFYDVMDDTFSVVTEIRLRNRKRAVVCGLSASSCICGSAPSALCHLWPGHNDLSRLLNFALLVHLPNNTFLAAQLHTFAFNWESLSLEHHSA